MSENPDLEHTRNAILARAASEESEDLRAANAAISEAKALADIHFPLWAKAVAALVASRRKYVSAIFLSEKKMFSYHEYWAESLFEGMNRRRATYRDRIVELDCIDDSFRKISSRFTTSDGNVYDRGFFAYFGVINTRLGKPFSVNYDYGQLSIRLWPEEPS